METLEGTPPAVDWHRRAFELATELGRIGPLTDAGDYSAALRAAANVDRAMPALLAQLVDEGRAAGLTWRGVAAALDRHPDTAKETYARRNRHRLGRNTGGRRREPASASPAGDGAGSLEHVA